MKYLPTIQCAKCGTNLPPNQMFRVHEAQTNRRYIIARCHGERQHVEFVDDPSIVVVLWGEINEIK